MGCFLACFGGDKDRRRRKAKAIKRNPSREGLKLHESRGLLQPIASPERSQQLENPLLRPPQSPQLPPDEEVVFDPKPQLRGASEEWRSAQKQLPEKKIPSPVLNSRDKSETPSFSSPKKKVTFDLNVNTYELIPVRNDELCSSQEVATEEENKGGEEEKKPKTAGAFTLNHRYQNFMNSDDENFGDDEDGDHYNDVDDEDVDNIDDEDNTEDVLLDYNKYAVDVGGDEEEEESYDSYFSLPLEKERQSLADVSSASKPAACSSPDRQPAILGGQTARDRSRYVHSVLNPVENLLQWKEVKAKAQPLKQHPKKENVDVEPGSEIPPSLQQPTFGSPKIHVKQGASVDASLSSWLPSSSEAVHGSNGSSSRRSNSPISLDDRPILGALTVEDLKKQPMSSPSPRRSPSRSPDEIPIVGTVGSYWNCTNRDEGSGSSSLYRSRSDDKGIPNTTSKYREDKIVNWHATPFQVRLEKALHRGDAEAYSSFPPCAATLQGNY